MQARSLVACPACRCSYWAMDGDSTRPGTQLPADAWTIAAIGILAYVAETVGHELVGHGGLCLLSGGRITALAPLWMRCSIQTIPVVAAGPAFNFIAAALLAQALRVRTWPGDVSYFLWLCCAFNVLVACGYLIVGGSTTWGDWGVVFAGVSPVWIWRAALVAIGAAGYLLALRGLGRTYARIGGEDAFAPGVFRRRTLLAGAAAALVAVGAEIAGGRWALGSLGLSLGCTLFVGWTLSLVGKPAEPGPAPARTAPSPAWIVAGLVTAGLFVGLVGPVATFC